MARGGLRPGAGRPKGYKKLAGFSPKEIRKAARASGMKPLEYMLFVMNDDGAEPERRDRMAIAAAPFMHARAEAEAAGKKEQRQARAEKSASAGRFAVPSGPKLVVDNRG